MDNKQILGSFNKYENINTDISQGDPNSYRPYNNQASCRNDNGQDLSKLEDISSSNPMSNEPPSKTNCQVSSGLASNAAVVDSPFSDSDHASHQKVGRPAKTQLLSRTEISASTIRIGSKGVPSNELVARLITIPSLCSMDSLKEWSINSFKNAKQILNEKRGIGSITSDVQLQSDIEQLKTNQNRLIRMLKVAQHMRNNYNNLVENQKQLYSLMSEMSIKSFQISSIDHHNGPKSMSISSKSKRSLNGKQIVTNFSSLSNNLSSTFTTNSNRTNNLDHRSDTLNNFIPIFDHIKNSSADITQEFGRNAALLGITIKNGEKLVAALTFFCSNLSTLIYKAIDDTLATIKQLESVRLDYDAERNSLNSSSSTLPHQMVTSYSSDRLELAKARYEQLRVDVQIKLRFLEENTIKVVHKQLIIFHSAFSSYSSGNTDALDAALKQFSIKI